MSKFSVDPLDEYGAGKIKDIDDLRTAIINSPVRLSAPERFGTGAVDVFSENKDYLDPTESLFDGQKLKYDSVSFSEPKAPSDSFDLDGKLLSSPLVLLKFECNE